MCTCVITENIEPTLQGILFIFSKFKISDESYHGTSLKSDLLSLNSINNELNYEINISHCLGNILWTVVSIESEIT